MFLSVSRWKKILNRKAKPIDTLTIRNRDLRTLLFAQMHLYTQEFFLQKYGQTHTIQLSQLPHSLFLEKHLDDTSKDHSLSEYVRLAHQYHFRETDTVRTDKYVEEFVKLFKVLENRRNLDEKAISQITVCRRPDGRLLLIDGVRRASAALRLGLDIKAGLISTEEYLRTVGTFRWARKKGANTWQALAKPVELPYQSIFIGGRLLVSGQRDIRERMRLINRDDLLGKTVLDLGCNIGMSCFFAAESGSSSIVGVDRGRREISTAIRLNSFFAAPCRFIRHDCNYELVNIPSFDTVFCFSLFGKLESTDGLIATILKKTKSVLYFEGHPRTQLSDYESLLNDRNFSSIELIGYMDDFIATRKANRPLYRCEVRRPTSALKQSSEIH